MSITYKDKGNMKIRIRRRYRYFKAKNIIMILCLITISLMSGAIGAEFIVDKYLSDLISVQTDKSDNSEPFSINKYTEVINKVCDSVVTISDSPENLESNVYHNENITGVIVDSKGYIITKLSKVESYDNIYVKLSSKASPSIEANLVGSDALSDIAILKISNENLQPVELADGNSVKDGDNVIVIGNATSNDNIGICTNGIITSINEKIVENNDVCTLIQTNAIINEFNDAGPICNMDGKFIGFASDDLSKKYNKQGLYYGISFVNVKNIINNLISFESIIGITGKEIDLEQNRNGLYIETLIPNGYAAKAGIKSSDILTKIDNKDIKSNEDVYEAIKNKKNGDIAVCSILRDGQLITITINFNK